MQWIEILLFVIFLTYILVNNAEVNRLNKSILLLKKQVDELEDKINE